MHIFFKLVAIGGIGGAIGGTTYFARQEYTNIHNVSSNLPVRKTLGEKETIDIRRQPKFGPRKEDESDDSESDTSVTKPEAGGGGSGDTPSSKDLAKSSPDPKVTPPKAPVKPGPASKSPPRPKPAKPSSQKPQVGKRVVKIKKPASSKSKPK